LVEFLHMKQTGARSPCLKQEKPDTPVSETRPSNFIGTSDS
jgi:hypothetical protein